MHLTSLGPKPSPIPIQIHLKTSQRTAFRKTPTGVDLANPLLLLSHQAASVMGGGQKRGRTQRRHFKQNRDNVWKHNPNKAPPAAQPSGGPTVENPTEENPTWQPFATQNPGFDEYYKEQRIVGQEEWDEFISTLRKPLPAAFRINASAQFSEDIRSQLEKEFAKSLEAEANNENGEKAIRPLPWYPGNLAWQLNFSRMQLRKNQALERFHEFLKQENEIGNITRQEAVSMVPPLFLNVLPEHHILDMCAAPGSKTFQLLEIIHGCTKPGQLPDGLVIANDVDVQRCNLLIHQTKRMSTANLIVTNHEAQHFPGISMGGDGQVEKSQLLFDRVLCDVPCSGDGTLRKAPDIWRKWNAGMGNGLHCLQVAIAMRGLALLKVGGRMVYSTCSMNPVENEAVVAEILRRCEGSVELLDVSNELAGLVRRPGLKTWKVRDRGSWFTTYKDVSVQRRSAIVQSMFPSCQSWKETVNEGAMNHLTEGSVNEEPRESDASAKLGEMEVSVLPLERCMRIVPHDQNNGAFFIAVLQKISPLPANHSINKQTKSKQRDGGRMSAKLEEESEIQKAESVLEINTDSKIIEENTETISEKKDQEAVPLSDNNDSKIIEEKTETISEKKDQEAVPLSDNNDENGVQIGKTDNRKRKLQMQGKWRGVDPVVFFTDETIINSIITFYGVSANFPLAGHLVTRNDESTNVKRIYYVSRSVREILELNLQVGQRLKITSLGLKIFERQTVKDEAACAYRISSEGLQLLFPYLTKQILYAPFSDFEHLLKYRAVKFVDFVDSTLGQKASALLPGCCVVVLHQVGNNSTDLKADASTIAIVCWKGKSNLSIMVSPSDAKELLERLEIRLGKKDVTASVKVLEESVLLEDDSVVPPHDVEPVNTTENMEEEVTI
ncbi:S-adenosyl-L-methionine-dependent methyltransferases superfamily protein [Rhynchospora pubera]|uniref:S-adenosyl-L-methionine-dependent methyltransferases superfamily protein n=1 Tax=Rhynchospora pubera TaxID=906938 RepID=A0AAV8CTB6_9POAL|nr:S-adenosyl-L-methionine-dependent methyltransferases superfamily protein [Rhynchospora pubera]